MKDFFSNIDDKLIDTFKDSPALQPMAMPEPKVEVERKDKPVPISKSTGLPEYVVDSIERTKLANQTQIRNSKARTVDLISLISSTSEAIDVAQENIANTPGGTVGEILGFFNDDYDVDVQRENAAKAKRNFETQLKIKEQSAILDALNVKEAALDFDSYVETQKQKGTAAAGLSQQRMYAKDNLDYMLKLGKHEFSKLDTLTITERYKKGQFDDIVTRERAEKHVQGMQTFSLKTETAKVVLESGRADLKKKLIESAIGDLDIPNLQGLLDSSPQGKPIEYGGVTIPRALVVTSLNSLMESENKSFEWATKQARDTFNNDAGFGALLKDIGTLSGVSNGSGVLNMFDGLHRGNITEEIVNKLDFSKMDPAIGVPMQKMFQRLAFMNQNDQASTPEGLKLITDMTADLGKVVANVKKTAIESVDKKLQPAYKEFYTNRKVTTMNNAVTVMTHLKGFQPENLDQTMSLMSSEFNKKILEMTSEKKLDLENMDSAEIMQEMLSGSLQQSLLKNPDKVLQASAGLSTLFGNTERKNVMDMAMRQLVVRFPELGLQLMDEKGRLKSMYVQKAGELARTLALFSAGHKSRGKDVPNNYLNTEFAAEVSKVIEANNPRWVAHQNVEVGALKKIVYGGQTPSQLIRASLAVAHNRWTQDAWERALKPRADNLSGRNAGAN